MNNQTFLLLSTLIALTLVGCEKEDSSKRKITVTPRGKEPQAVITNKPPTAGPSSSTDAETESQSIEQTRKRIFAEITQLIAKPDAGFSIEDWISIKERYWKPDFDRIVQPAAKSSNVQDVLAIPEGKESLIVQIWSGRFTETSDIAEQNALIALQTMALMTAASGGMALPAALEERKADANITRGDVILFTVFDDAFIDVPRRDIVSESELDQWQQLATSPNSLCRLLALRTYRRVAPNPEMWLNFYRTYVDEQDQGILEEVADIAFQTARPEAAEVLAEIRTRPRVAANLDFADKLDRSIDFLQKLPTRGQ